MTCTLLRVLTHTSLQVGPLPASDSALPLCPFPLATPVSLLILKHALLGPTAVS